MPETNSAEYYRGREQQERALATAAVNPNIAAIHIEMADRYLKLVAQADLALRPRLKLRAVA